MNDIMAVDHGIVWFWKSSIRGAVNRTVAVACRAKILGSELGSCTEGKMEGQWGEACTRGRHFRLRTHTHTHKTCVWSDVAAVTQGGLITVHQISYQSSWLLTAARWWADSCTVFKQSKLDLNCNFIPGSWLHLEVYKVQRLVQQSWKTKINAVAIICVKLQPGESHYVYTSPLLQQIPESSDQTKTPR